MLYTMHTVTTLRAVTIHHDAINRFVSLKNLKCQTKTKKRGPLGNRFVIVREPETNYAYYELVICMLCIVYISILNIYIHTSRSAS